MGPLSRDSARHFISSLASICMQHIPVQNIHHTCSCQLLLTRCCLILHPQEGQTGFFHPLLLATQFLCPESGQTSSPVQTSPTGTQQLPAWLGARKPQGTVRLPGVCQCFPLSLLPSEWWAGGRAHRPAVSTHSEAGQGIPTPSAP